MATIIYRHQIYENDHLFRTTDNYTLCVTDFKDGIATIKPLIGTIQTFARNLAGCFRVKSNFKRELLKAYHCGNGSREGTPFKGIRFKFNGAEVLVTKENANEDEIYTQWREAMSVIAEKERLELEAYMKTAEYRRKMAKALKRQVRRKTVEKDVIVVDETTEMEFKNEEAAKNWSQWVEVNSQDGYSFGVVTYARRWAKYMQHLIGKQNKTVADIANKSSYVCDIEGITGFMYGSAVAALSEFWKYGDELLRWHNRQYGYDGDKGGVKPTIISLT